MAIFPLRLSAISSRPRLELVGQLAAVLNELGWVLESHPYSNIALAIDFEISAGNVPKLRPALVALPLAWSDSSLDALAGIERTLLADRPGDLQGSVHVTFVHAEPDLHLDIPAVPG